MIEISKTFTFEAAHFLPLVPEGHKCGRVHGHSYTVTVTLQGMPDSDYGWLMDFGDLGDLCRSFVTLHLDHRTLNDVPGLENPTSEFLATWIYHRLFRAIPARCRLSAVEVSETCTSAARYLPD